LGSKKQIPTLPDHIIKLQAHPTIRVYRIIGGLSFLIMISKTHLNYPNYAFYLVISISIFFTIYQFYLSYHRIKHFIKIMKSDKLEVRNSPLDRLAYLSAKALWCLKIGCDQAQPIGLALGLMIAYDEILKGGNNEALFMPLLGEMLNKVSPSNNEPTTSKLIQDALDNIKDNKNSINFNNSILDQVKDLNLSGDFTKDEVKEIEDILKNNQDKLNNKNSELKSKILELLDKEK
jgi:hypothetical protein